MLSTIGKLGLDKLKHRAIPASPYSYEYNYILYGGQKVAMRGEIFSYIYTSGILPQFYILYPKVSLQALCLLLSVMKEVELNRSINKKSTAGFPAVDLCILKHTAALFTSSQLGCGWKHSRSSPSWLSYTQSFP